MAPAARLLCAKIAFFRVLFSRLDSGPERAYFRAWTQDKCSFAAMSGRRPCTCRASQVPRIVVTHLKLSRLNETPFSKLGGWNGPQALNKSAVVANKKERNVAAWINNGFSLPQTVKGSLAAIISQCPRPGFAGLRRSQSKHRRIGRRLCPAAHCPGVTISSNSNPATERTAINRPVSSPAYPPNAR
jgi:hypothetical protein